MASDPSGGRVDEALEITSRGLRITEQVPLPLAYMPAALFEEVGAYCFSKATQLSARGEVGQAQEMLSRSVAMLERARQIDDENGRLGRERLLRLGQRPDDIPDVGTASIYTKLGAAYMALREPHRAIEALRRVRLLQPVSFDALFQLARAEGAAAEAERAAEWQRRMIGDLQVPAELFDTPRKGR
jgi:tetratricopeptide (TPR) repeat protein